MKGDFLLLTCKKLAGRAGLGHWLRGALGTQALFWALLS